MSDSLSNLNEQWIEFYRQHALDVFRYHLVRSGDWQDAEALTAETFRRAQGWFARQLAVNGEAKIWLFRTAVAMYARFRRPPGFSRGDENLASPTQEQLPLFARAAELHEQWHRLPRKEQDARALYLFAGLEFNEVAAVTGWKLQDAAERLGRLVGDQVELRLLASQLQPVSYFLGRLENELRESIRESSDNSARLGRAKWMWLRYRIGPLLTLIGQVLPLLLLAGSLVWVVNDYTRQTAPLVAESAEQPTQLPRRRNSEPTGRTAFLPSQDKAVLVSLQGGIFVYDLSDGNLARMVRLSEDGFLGTRGLDPAYPAQVSPNGDWLSVVRLLDGSTWLLRLDGTQRRQISASSLHLTWAPDSGEVIYPVPDDPRRLVVYNADASSIRELARFPGEIKGAAWSPDGRLIGVAYQSAGSGPDMLRTSLGLIPRQGGARVVLVTHEEHVDVQTAGNGNSFQRLLWTDDNSELWYPHWYGAVNIDQTLAAELSTDIASRPVGQNLNLPLQPLIAQPFYDRYGVQRQLLYGSENSDEPPLLRSVVVSSDRRQIALLLANPNGVVGSVAVQDSVNLEENRWIRSFGRVGKISWTAEGGSLLASEYADQPGQLYRINARNGRNIVIAEDHWMIGTLSELRYAAGNHAPQSMKIPLTSPDMSGPTVRVEHPGLGISLEVPAQYRIWQMAGGDPNGAMIVTNFDLGDPLGYVSLTADDFMMVAMRIGGPETQIQRILNDMNSTASQGYDVQTLNIDGRTAFRRVIYRGNQPTIANVYLVDPNGPIMLYYQPDNTNKEGLFERMIASLNVVQAQIATPAPQPEQPTPTVEVAWDQYTSPNLGVSFDLPAPYLGDPVCGARETGKLVQVGSQIYIATDRLGGHTLSDYVDARLKLTDSELIISKREARDLPGGEAITLEGSLSSIGFFSQTYIRSGDQVWLIGLTPNQSCDGKLALVSDLQVYRRLVTSLRVLQ